MSDPITFRIKCPHGDRCRGVFEVTVWPNAQGGADESEIEAVSACSGDDHEGREAD